MTDSEKEVEDTKATEEEVLQRSATEESDVKASAERRKENTIERGGKVENASDVLKTSGEGETDINPLDGKEIDKDSQFNPTRDI